MPAIVTKAVASAQGYGFSLGGKKAVYVEDVFSTYLYTGTSSSQTITNGIDLSTKGGMVWLKARSNAYANNLYDTARGANNWLETNGTNPAYTQPNNELLNAFNTDGFTLGSDPNQWFANKSGVTYASWTFRKQAKFFDVVTYTGTGSATTIAHNLGCVPGMIIVKRTDAGGDNWIVYHKSLSPAYDSILQLNTTNAVNNSATGVWNSTSPTSSVFTVGTNAQVNASGGTYVAYLFADSNSGGFGAAGTDSVVACGSFTGPGVVNLGWEPQYIIYKKVNGTSSWLQLDTMRGWTANSNLNATFLIPNESIAEFTESNIRPTSTGFDTTGNITPGDTWIYLAIRRGPMKTPTDATKVFKPASMNSDPVTVDYGFPLDLFMTKGRAGDSFWWADRLRGINTVSTSNTSAWLSPGSVGGTAAEGNYSGMYLQGQTSMYASGNPSITGNNITFALRRAPGFFDVVCYTGTGSATTVTHNLGVAPELMIVKGRDNAPRSWVVMPNNATKGIILNSDGAIFDVSSYWNDTPPTSTVFTLGNQQNVNAGSSTYVAYLFATCAGVSKVGSYTGTGAAQNIDCGFSAAARFIMIKRTDSTGDWYVYNSVDGISSSTDPYVLMNGTSAQVTGTDYVNTYSTGFALTSSAPAALNANGGSYIFLAIA